MKLNSLRENNLRVAARIMITLLVAGGILGMASCNTVRGVGKDISSAADALDPNER